MDRICKACRHWDFEQGDMGFGRCTMADKDWSESLMCVWVNGSCHDGEPMLSTRADFGCNQWDEAGK